MKDDQELADMIEAEARRNLPSDMIVRVRLKRDIDRDGDPIMWVKIVVTRAFMALAPKRTIPFGPLLRKKLWDIEEPAAPVLIYVVEDEDRDFNAAAA